MNELYNKSLKMTLYNITGLTKYLHHRCRINMFIKYVSILIIYPTINKFVLIGCTDITGILLSLNSSIIIPTILSSFPTIRVAACSSPQLTGSMDKHSFQKLCRFDLVRYFLQFQNWSCPFRDRADPNTDEKFIQR